MVASMGWLSRVAGRNWNWRTAAMTRASQSGVRDLTTWMVWAWPVALTWTRRPTSAGMGTAWLRVLAGGTTATELRTRGATTPVLTRRFCWAEASVAGRAARAAAESSNAGSSELT